MAYVRVLDDVNSATVRRSTTCGLGSEAGGLCGRVPDTHARFVMELDGIENVIRHKRNEYVGSDLVMDGWALCLAEEGQEALKPMRSL